jgi:hypothetical protein
MASDKWTGIGVRVETHAELKRMAAESKVSMALIVERLVAAELGRPPAAQRAWKQKPKPAPEPPPPPPRELPRGPWYLAAPVAPTEDEELDGNLVRAEGYLRTLVRAGLLATAPWIGLCYALDDDRPWDRERGMEIDLMALRVSCGLVGCGPRWSRGMDEERAEAIRQGLPVVDLVGVHPRDYYDHPELLRVVEVESRG